MLRARTLLSNERKSCQGQVGVPRSGRLFNTVVTAAALCSSNSEQQQHGCRCLAIREAGQTQRGHAALSGWPTHRAGGSRRSGSP